MFSTELLEFVLKLYKIYEIRASENIRQKILGASIKTPKVLQPTVVA